jgi:hypothetical protein
MNIDHHQEAVFRNIDARAGGRIIRIREMLCRTWLFHSALAVAPSLCKIHTIGLPASPHLLNWYTCLFGQNGMDLSFSKASILSPSSEIESAWQKQPPLSASIDQIAFTQRSNGRGTVLINLKVR